MKAFRSLGVRIYCVAALTALAALLLGLMILQSSTHSRQAFDWVGHSQEVILSLDGIESSLTQAESRLRGFLMTRDASYVAGFDGDLATAKLLSAKLTSLVTDNPVQHGRAVRLEALTAEKAGVMAAAEQRTLANPVGSLPNPKARLQGRNLMTAVGREVGTIRTEERQLLLRRTDEAQAEVAQSKTLLLYGFPLLVLLIGGIAWFVSISISRPLAELLDVVTRFGAGDRDARASIIGHSVEFRRLAFAYNEMADRLMTVNDRQEKRQYSVQILSEMSQRLQAIQNDGELAEVLDCFLPQVMPDLAGILYLHNHSRNMLIPTASWGHPQVMPEMFPPANCWGLRRGQTHAVGKLGDDLICDHAAGPVSIDRRCEPLLAGGEVLGLLYIEGPIADEAHFRLRLLKESVALALVNDNLRSRLREQSIRDPLTKLFNRRYMEEALALETARAKRSAAPLSIVMCDVDHFKRFNDGHGHEAGDQLLAAIARLIQSQFRDGDIVCRYGGEEFIVIAPGASPALVESRAEALRLAVRNLTVENRGHRLGPVTMSFGIDSWDADEGRPVSALLGEADRALFEAKRLGRDRVQIAATSQVRLEEAASDTDR
ncbi:diguanylate cyclase [Sphingomonas sp. R86520]|uniref:sensor domain-containing diguanylate cyclase n=1 Tax=Sphingomonas sp. R86520 TaxID=3093859 RepID=UPI0036D3DEC9